MLAAVEHPGERELPWGDALLRRELLDALGEREVPLQVLAGEARAVAAEVALVELLGRAEAPRQEAASERRVGDQADAELLERSGITSCSMSRVHSEYSLCTRGDRVHGVRAADRLGRGLGEAEVANLALLHELGHRADGLLDRRVGVHAVLVVEVDVVGPQPPQRGLAGGAHVLGAAVDAAPQRLGLRA